MVRGALAVLSLAFVISGCSGAAKCDAQSCATGCCDSSGECQLQSNLTCGTAGQTCNACGIGQSCVLGACTGAIGNGGGTGTGGGTGSGGSSGTGGSAGTGGSSGTGGGSGVPCNGTCTASEVCHPTLNSCLPKCTSSGECVAAMPVCAALNGSATFCQCQDSSTCDAAQAGLTCDGTSHTCRSSAAGGGSGSGGGAGGGGGSASGGGDNVGGGTAGVTFAASCPPGAFTGGAPSGSYDVYGVCITDAEVQQAVSGLESFCGSGSVAVSNKTGSVSGSVSFGALVTRSTTLNLSFTLTVTGSCASSCSSLPSFINSTGLSCESCLLSGSSCLCPVSGVSQVEWDDEYSLSGNSCALSNGSSYSYSASTNVVRLKKVGGSSGSGLPELGVTTFW